MSSPPWKKPTDNLFGQREQPGNDSPHHATYANAKWRRVSGPAFKGKKCEVPMCLRMAQLVDHIFPIRQGGSQYDRRNWQYICNYHHNKKRGRESHGQYCESVDTATGKIPANLAHLPPDIAGETYMITPKTNG